MKPVASEFGMDWVEWVPPESIFTVEALPIDAPAKGAKWERFRARGADAGAALFDELQAQIGTKWKKIRMLAAEDVEEESPKSEVRSSKSRQAAVA